MVDSVRRVAAPRHCFAVAAALGLLFIAAAALTTPAQRFVNDSYRYTVATLGFLGGSPASAHRLAVDAYCLADATRSVRGELLRPDRLDDVAARPISVRQADCVAEHAEALEPTDPRYTAIFAPRVGYPLLAAPFVAVLGVAGMWLAAAVCTAAAGGLVFALLRSWGAPILAAAAGQVGLYVSPAGQWGMWALAEGPSLLALTAAVVGACWVIDQRRGGVALLVAGLAFGVAVKYSSGLITAGLLAAAAALLVFVRPRATVVAVIAALFAAGTLVAQRALGLPGVDTTLQDLFTGHFIRPEVADPWSLWWTQTGHFWVQWVPDHPVLLIGAAAALWAAGRVHAPLVAVPLLVGLAAQAALPSASQADRLYTPAWLTIAIGLPMLAMALRPSTDSKTRHARSIRSTRLVSSETSSAS